MASLSFFGGPRVQPLPSIPENLERIGALVVGAVERAVNAALQRDIREERATPSGIRLQDVEDVVQAAFVATQDLNLNWLVHEVLGTKMPTKIVTVFGRPIMVGGTEQKIKVTHEIKEDRGW